MHEQSPNNTPSEDAVSPKHGIPIIVRVVPSTTFTGLLQTGDDCGVVLLRLGECGGQDCEKPFVDYGTGDVQTAHRGDIPFVLSSPSFLEVARERCFRGLYSPPSAPPRFDEKSGSNGVGEEWARRLFHPVFGLPSLFPVSESHHVIPVAETAFFCEFELREIVPTPSRDSFSRVNVSISHATFSNVPLLQMHSLVHRRHQIQIQPSHELHRHRVCTSAGLGRINGRYGIHIPSTVLSQVGNLEGFVNTCSREAVAPSSFVATSCHAPQQFTPTKVQLRSPSRSPTKRSNSPTKRRQSPTKISVGEAASGVDAPGSNVEPDPLSFVAASHTLQVEAVVDYFKFQAVSKSTSKVDSGISAVLGAFLYTRGLCHQSGMPTFNINEMYARLPVTQLNAVSSSGCIVSPLQLNSSSATDTIIRLACSFESFFRFIERQETSTHPMLVLYRLLTAARIPQDVGYEQDRILREACAANPQCSPSSLATLLRSQKCPSQPYSSEFSDYVVGSVLSFIAECQQQDKSPLAALGSHFASLSKRGVTKDPLLRALAAEVSPNILMCVRHPLCFLYPHLEEFAASATFANLRGGYIVKRAARGRRKLVTLAKKKTASGGELDCFAGSAVVWVHSTREGRQSSLWHARKIQEVLVHGEDDGGNRTMPALIWSLPQSTLKEASAQFYPFLYGSYKLLAQPAPTGSPPGNVAFAVGGAKANLPVTVHVPSIVSTINRGFPDASTTHPLQQHLLSISTEGVFEGSSPPKRPASTTKVRRLVASVSAETLPFPPDQLPLFPPCPPTPASVVGQLPSPFDSFFEDRAGTLPMDSDYFRRLHARDPRGGFGTRTAGVDRMKGGANLASPLFLQAGPEKVATPSAPYSNPLHPSLDTYRQHLVTHFLRQPPEVDLVTYAHHVATTVHHYVAVILAAGGVPSTAVIRSQRLAPPTISPAHIATLLQSTTIGEGPAGTGLSTSWAETKGADPLETIQRLKAARIEGEKEVAITTTRVNGEDTLDRIEVDGKVLFKSESGASMDDVIREVLEAYGYPSDAVWPTPAAVSLSTLGVAGGASIEGKQLDLFTSLIPNAKEHTRILKGMVGEGILLDAAMLPPTLDAALLGSSEASKQAAVLQLHHDYRLLLARCLFTLIIGDETGRAVVITPGREVARAVCPYGPPRYSICHRYRYGEILSTGYQVACSKETTFDNRYDKCRNELFSHVFGPSSLAIPCFGATYHHHGGQIDAKALQKANIQPFTVVQQDWWDHCVRYQSADSSLLEYVSEVLDVGFPERADDWDVQADSLDSTKTSTIRLLSRPPLTELLAGIATKRSKFSGSAEERNVLEARFFPATLFGPLLNSSSIEPPLPSTDTLNGLPLSAMSSCVGLVRPNLRLELLPSAKIRSVSSNSRPLEVECVEKLSALPRSVAAISMLSMTMERMESTLRYFAPNTTNESPELESTTSWPISCKAAYRRALDGLEISCKPSSPQPHPSGRSSFEQVLHNTFVAERSAGGVASATITWPRL